MCGIAGYISKDPKALQWLDGAIDYLSFRGPDGNGKYVQDSVGFGHTRLAIIDLSRHGEQPMVSSNNFITFNGEIYNYQELKTQLYVNDDLGLKNSNGNDAHTFLNYINKFGVEKAMDHSNGMFAFAYCDTTKQKVYLAVDRFAQKPLYYYENDSGFYFCSTLAGLVPLEHKWSIDLDALETFWHLGGVIGHNQIFKGMRKLCAGEMLEYDVKTSNYKVSTWYKPKVKKHTKNEVKDLVIKAISEVVVSDVPVNIFLSGGIDSTLVASLFRNHTAIHLKSPEIEYAKQVSDKFNLDLKVIEPENEDTKDIMTDFVTKSGELTMAGAIPWITAKYARKYGKVAVIANGADELFFGYDRLINDSLEYSKRQLDHTFRGTNYPHDKLNKYRKKWNYVPSSRYTDLMTFVQYDLNRTLDHAAMCHGLEVRSPFLDHRLVEAALSIDETEHRTNGNKTILKEMLEKMGFNQNFITRPKNGFSMHYQPQNFEAEKERAIQFCINEKYLTIENNISGRDYLYLRNCALGFYYWFNTYKNVLQ